MVYPGPWPAKAFVANGIDPDAGRSIAERADAAGVRPLFVRRPGSAYEPHQEKFEWAYVDTQTRITTWHEPTSLAGIAASQWPDEATANRSSAEEPLYLVCTHGRRDQCCATLGRPVAAEFAGLRPEQAWECSHVGGHRLASVVVALPRGDIYGMVDPGDAAVIIAATERGEVHVPLFRGSSNDGPVVQAAKAHVLKTSDSARPDDLQVIRREQLDEHRWEVEIVTRGLQMGQWRCLVTQRAVLAPASCGKPAESIKQWHTELY